MSGLVCPWWLGYLLLSPLRRLRQNPAVILEAYVRPGMTVLEPGPGMGFFTLELAGRVGKDGRVVVVDVQARMLEALRRRAARAGVAERIEARLATGASLGVDDLAGVVDFVFAFAVVHELPDCERFFAEVARTLKPRGQVLVSEPRLHVSQADFEATERAAVSAGLVEEARPEISGSRSVLFARRDPSTAGRS
jgi:ubiquinone/menaquinone biosynthesis C-methylase UbiE